MNDQHISSSKEIFTVIPYRNGEAVEKSITNALLKDKNGFVSPKLNKQISESSHHRIKSETL